MLADIMTRDVLTTTADVSVADAARLMTERNAGSVCVVDRAGNLEGIITERDVLRAAATGTDLSKVAIRDWMTGDVITVGPDEIPSEIAQVMQERGFRHLPVVDRDSLVGIVSMRDLWHFTFLPQEPDDMTLRH
ncbi:MAG: CBS domain-containing protein [Actinomycetota bacterium]|nr:CBS domain-containing protein [Actinomycetota bacterium]